MISSVFEPSRLTARAAGLEFSCLQWSPPETDNARVVPRGLVLASHGFPDHSRTFRFLGPALAEAGYRVVAPDLRGYAECQGDKGPFHPLAIARDIVELVQALRRPDEKLFLVGHDWGAAATYLAAAALGTEVERIATLAVPQGNGFLQALVTNPEQQRRSWYMFFFQLPMAEQAVAHDDFAFIDRLWSDWSPGFRLPDGEMSKLKGTLRADGVLGAALQYYRDAFQPPVPSEELAAFGARTAALITAPCLYLHGDLDGCIGFEASAGMEQGFAGGLRRELLDGVGHFLHLEAPERVQSRILAFFGKSDT